MAVDMVEVVRWYSWHVFTGKTDLDGITTIVNDDHLILIINFTEKLLGLQSLFCGHRGVNVANLNKFPFKLYTGSSFK